MPTTALHASASSAKLQTIWVVVALVALSATRLRLPSVPIGVGESMLLAWAIVFFLRRSPGWGLNELQSVLLRFWVPLAALIALGALWAALRDTSSPGSVRDAIAFAFAALISFAFAGMLGARGAAVAAARWLVTLLTAYLGVLALVHLVVPDLVTVPNRYASRLTAVTANPNQLAMYLAPLPFLTIYLLPQLAANRLRMALLAGLVLQALAARAVASDALWVSWMIGAVAAFVGLLYLRRRRGPQTQDRVVSLALAGILAVGSAGLAARYAVPSDLKADVEAAVAGAPSIEDAPEADWEKVQVRVRGALWRSGLEVISMSPLVGFGPGRHAGNGVPFQGEEAHNSFIDIATMGGIPAALLLAWFLWTAASPRGPMNAAGLAACAVVVAVAVFASFHFMLRQPMFWFYLILAAALRRADTDPGHGMRT